MPSLPMNPKPWIAFIVGVALSGIVWGLVEAVSDPHPNLRHPAIIDSAYFAFALWAGSILVQLQTTRDDWRACSGGFRVGRAAWVGGLVVFLTHLGLAFHLAHDWSQTRAYEHVEASSGFGSGLFVSYGFALLWIVDGISWCVAPSRYARRAAWIPAGLHVFMGFIAFNATVVFGQSPLRWVAAGAFALLVGQLFKLWFVARTPLGPDTP